jgi:hypothetical protein
MQGSHPDGTDESALDHILAGEQIIPPDKGLFLEETWRLHPDICAYTSELFYAGKLRSHAGLEKQAIKSVGPLSGSGLRYLAVAHSGNQNCSPEEAQAIATLVETTINGKSTWIDGDGQERVITFEDIVIITPYNAQVFEIQQRMPSARVGTVDNFKASRRPSQSIRRQHQAMRMHRAVQPQSVERCDLPRQVHICHCRITVVASPQVAEAECHTPRQIQLLVNALCRYLELATPIQ